MDGGASWIPVNNGLTDLHITTVYSSGNGIFAGTSDGVFFSADNGLTWTARNNGIPYTYSIYSWSQLGDTIYAGTYGQGLFKTVNNGVLWTQVASGFPVPVNTGPFVYAMAASGNTIFAGTDLGIYLTTNGGASWFFSGNQFMTNEHAKSLAIVNGSLIAGTFNKGIGISTDNAVSFVMANNGLQWWPGVQTYLPASDFVSTGGALLAATWFGMYRSTDNGQQWNDSNNGILATSVTKVYTNGQTVFAGTEFTGMYASTDKGASWQRANNGLQANHVLTGVTQGDVAFASILNKKVSKTQPGGPVATATRVCRS